MTLRILSRALRQLRGQTWVLYVLALVVVAAVAVPAFSHWRRGEPIFSPVSGLSKTDCADTFMAVMAGPNEQGTRAAYACASPAIQRNMGGSEAAAVAANAKFEPEPAPVRVGQSAVFDDGSYYVYFYGIGPQGGSQHAWFVLTIVGGKVAVME